MAGLCSALAVACGSSTKATAQDSTFDASVMDSTATDGPAPSDSRLPAPPNDGCVHKTCAELGYDCGQNVDNCGSVIAGGCGQCSGGQTCGGGGFSKCGGGSPEASMMDACVPLSCQGQGIQCGPAGNGCGGLIQSCGTCSPPEFCGGGGPSVCGGNLDASPDACVPETCPVTQQCGFAGDGCGHVLVCGTCPAGETCGGGGTPNVCGPVVTPSDGGDGGGPGCETCVELGYQCGPAGDGCGNVIQCGSCPTGETCGGGGPFKCGGGDACVAMTCQEQGFGCGMQGDGCGHTIDCGTCPAGQTCGGPGAPNVCVGNCTDCPPPNPCDVGITSISGKVVAGTPPIFGAPDPVPNVVVYVPGATVQPFTPGVSCAQCGSDLSGSPIVQTVTGVDGSFQLNDVPITANMPLVIQLGRWRKQLVVPQTTACQNTSVGTITMPHNHLEGDIPLTAISTGNVDPLECVLLKMGVDATEFTLPASAGGTGRIQLYVGNGSNEGFGNPGESTLTTSPGALAMYDEVLFPCWGDDPTLSGSPNAKTPAAQENVINYTSLGGRMFATHYSYAWLYDVAPFSGTAVWNPNYSDWPSVEATIDTSLPVTLTFENWMVAIGASLPNGQFQVDAPRHDFDSVVAPAVRWVFTPDHETFPLQYTFDTPYGGMNTCGRVIFSDFHVVSNNDTGGAQFPTECSIGSCTATSPCPMSPQEKALEYLLWSLDTCVPPVCTPLTCLEQNITCGAASNGCGGTLDCGPCPPPALDGCVPETCAEQNLSCGPAGDGCGNLIQCGDCPAPQTCGGCGQPGVCCAPPDGGSPDGCPSESCTSQNIGCGPAGDGCGHELDCGICAAPLTCGGGGVNGQCGGGQADACVPKTCAELGVQCGYVANGCGGLAGVGGDPPSCGTCPAGQTCSGGMCVTGGSVDACVGMSCQALGIQCGPTGDGCGNLIQCGTCPAGESCGGACGAGMCCAGNN